MKYALVRSADLALLGLYDAELPRPDTGGIVSLPVHPALHDRPVVVQMVGGLPQIVAAPRELTFEDKKAALLKQFDDETKAFILARYQIERQTSFILLLTTALFEGKANRAAYVQQAVEYVNAVLSYHFGINAQIEAAETEEQLMAISWDFAPYVASDPRTSIETALGIPD